MGKGDQRTRRGKIYRGSFGKSRRKDPTKNKRQSAKTVKRRLKVWLRLGVFLRAWRQLAERYQRLRGINWDQVLLDGSKKPSKKGEIRPALRR